MMQPMSLKQIALLASLLCILGCIRLINKPSSFTTPTTKKFTTKEIINDTPPPHHRSLLYENINDNGDDTTTTGLKILTLGGASTGGATIPASVVNAYPHLIGRRPNTVRNIPTRATGAEFAGHCIESLLGGSEETFDVILLEFSQSGTKGLELLLKRLRQRYPDAIIIYIHLYSLQKDLVNEKGVTPLQTGVKSSKVKYHWGPGERASNDMFVQIQSIMTRYRGYMYALPRTTYAMNSEKWFAFDWQHLSVEGHRQVATDVLEMINERVSSLSYEKEKAREGMWADGDQCSTWFMDGHINLRFYGQAHIQGFEGFSGAPKYALQIKGPASLFVENTRDYIAPVYLSFMTKFGKYPRVLIEVNDKTITLNPESRYNVQRMKTAHVGWALTGMNEIKITPVSDWDLPFRVTGVNLCGACYFLSNTD